MTKAVKVVYDGYDKEVDDKICLAMASVDAKRWASGYNFETGERDLAFDMKIGA